MKKQTEKIAKYPNPDKYWAKQYPMVCKKHLKE